MNATRHSPSRFMARLPVSNPFDAESSSPSRAWNFTSLSWPYQSTRLFCQRKSFAQAGSFARTDFPDESTHLPPNIPMKRSFEFVYQPMNGSNPTTFRLPFLSRFVSFFAYAVSWEIVFGGPVSPAALNIFLL